MKMKFLAPPISLAALLFGLSYVDSSADEYVMRASAQVVEQPQTVDESREIAMDSASTEEIWIQASL